MTSHEKESRLQLKIDLNEEHIREQIECAKDSAQSFLANLADNPGDLKRALAELETMVDALKQNLRSAENADSRNYALREALAVLKGI